MITLRQLADITQGQLHGNVEEVIRDVFTDSRRSRLSQGQLFIALKGASHDGADYIEELYGRGFRLFLTHRMPETLLPEASFVRVEDTLNALQDWAKFHRKTFDIPLVAITGSNGKTIVKEWLSVCLEAHTQVVRTPRSHNSQVGVPLSVLGINDSHRIGVFEAGISLPGEMPRLKNILRPTVGIFTNIGTAHQANFSTVEEKVREKAALFADCRWVLTRPGITEEVLKMSGSQVITVGTDARADWQYECVGDEVVISHDGESHRFAFPFRDTASLENGAYAVVAAHLLGMPFEQIARQVTQWEPVEMRMEFVQGPGQRVVVNDAYATDPESLRVALEFLSAYRSDKPQVVVLTDFIQSDPDEEALYSRVGEWLTAHNPEAVVAIGVACARNRHFFPAQTHFFSTTEDLLAVLDGFSWNDTTILVKGARVFALERVVYRLARQTHRTILEVNFSSMERQLRKWRSQLPRDVKMMGMVKSFSYGIGAVEMARFLEYQHLDYLAVAYIDEGLELRKAGINLPIMVLNPDIGGFSLMHEYRLEPEIYRSDMIDAWRSMLRKRGDAQAPIHLKIDTGMNRLGFRWDEVEALVPQLNDINVASVMSHLSASDDESKRAFTEMQITRFKSACETLELSLGYRFMRHILNSNGIKNHAHAAFDMVRLGIGLYGIGSGAPALQWRAHISQIRRVKQGEPIGYGAYASLPHDGQMAVVSVGYGDGFRRCLSNGKGAVYINGHRCPVIGPVCMDVTMVDVTDVDCHEGDPVEIIGPHQSLEAMAQSMDTIPYEVLTGISPRVQRVYYRE